VATQQAFDAWLDDLLTHGKQLSSTENPRLQYLLALVREADIEISAEQIWQSFRLRYPSTQAHCSHWLQECIGIPLRKLLLWQKLRRALEALSSAHGATEVAHAAGFADSAHLSRICLRTFGLRPSQANDHKILQVNRFPDY
jgi:AraC-like DNA-binding protein